MDFKSVFNKLTSNSEGEKYFYTDPEITEQEKIVESLKRSGIDPSVIAAQEAQLAKMQSRRQQPRNENDFPTSLDFLKEKAPAFAAGINTPQPSEPIQPPIQSTPSSMVPPTPIPMPTQSSLETPSPMPMPSPDDDQMKRDALAKEQSKRKLSELFPQALAGFGDIVTATGAPYGTKQTQGFEKIKESQAESKKMAKEDLERKFLNDPTSSASRAAQSAAARLLRKKPEELANLSVAQIDKSFPLWKEALNNEEARELKKLQIEAMKQESESRKEFIQAGRDQKASERQADDFYKVGKDLVNDARYKEMGKQQLGLTSVRTLIEEVKSGNTVGAAAIGAKLARAMGEVGVLTEEDVKRYQRSGWWPQRIADKASLILQGRPSDMTLDEINQIANGIEKAFEANKKPIQEDYVKRLSRAYNIPEDKAAYLLNVPEIKQPVKSEVKPASNENLPLVTSQDEYNKLPIPSKYRTADGRIGTKRK